MSAQAAHSSARHSEERKASRPPPPIVEAHLITQHGQGGQEVEEAPSYNENLISFEPVYREEDVANIEVVDLQRTPHRYPNARPGARPSDQVSIYSDSGSVWEDVRSLQSELRRKRRELEEVRRRCIVAETAMQNGSAHTEHIKAKLLEEELEKARGDLRKRERELHGLASESEAAEKQHLRTMLSHKDHENQLLTKEVAGLRSEKVKLKERVEAMWRDYEKYKAQHEGILRSLEKERQVLLEKLSKRDPDLSRAETAEKEARIAALNTQLEELRAQLRSRDEQVDQLLTLVEQLQRENKSLLEAHTEPPPEEVQPEALPETQPEEAQPEEAQPEEVQPALRAALSHPEQATLPESPEEAPPSSQPEQTYEDPRGEPGPEVTPVPQPSVEEFEEVSLEETHPSQEEAKEPVRHGEEAAGVEIQVKKSTNPFAKSPAPEVSATNPFAQGPVETEKAEESKEEFEYRQKNDPFDLQMGQKAPSPPAKPQKSNPFIGSTEDDFFLAELRKKGPQDRKKGKPFTALPKTLFD